MEKRNVKSSFFQYIMLGKLPFVLGYGVYYQNGGSEKIFFQFLTSCKKCLDAGKLCFQGLFQDYASFVMVLGNKYEKLAHVGLRS